VQLVFGVGPVLGVESDFEGLELGLAHDLVTLYSVVPVNLVENCGALVPSESAVRHARLEGFPECVYN